MSQTYTHAPRPVSGPISFILDGDRLTVDSGRKVQEVRLGAVEQVRITYEPRSFAQKAFQTRLRLKDGKSVTFSSLSWRSFIEAERLDRDYRAFSRALLHAVAEANPEARFLAGRPPAIWVATLVLGGAGLLAMALFLWRAVEAGYTSAALMGAFFLAAGIWQLEPMIRLNKPRTFTADDPPRDLLP
ncbi:MAG TPA: hypothetical protein VIL09_13535 [Microvirga sp.]|jgi:hypothetical protein